MFSLTAFLYMLIKERSLFKPQLAERKFPKSLPIASKTNPTSVKKTPATERLRRKSSPGSPFRREWGEKRDSDSNTRSSSTSSMGSREITPMKQQIIEKNRLKAKTRQIKSKDTMHSSLIRQLGKDEVLITAEEKEESTRTADGEQIHEQNIISCLKKFAFYCETLSIDILANQFASLPVPQPKEYRYDIFLYFVYYIISLTFILITSSSLFILAFLRKKGFQTFLVLIRLAFILNSFVLKWALDIFTQIESNTQSSVTTLSSLRYDLFITTIYCICSTKPENTKNCVLKGDLIKGPISRTVPDFWRMIWQENVECIVMLCKTQLYFYLKQQMPFQFHVPLIFASGLLRVILIGRRQEEDLTISTIQLIHLEEARIITHYQWADWQDCRVCQSRINLVTNLAPSMHVQSLFTLLRRVRGSRFPVGKSINCVDYRMWREKTCVGVWRTKRLYFEGQFACTYI
uniref:Tyrosine-protein phosphatase domain-containing protein n=1 Tax=Heterorhabditis bacteriophora TaxID=37862 RepID=A0A1I7WZ81_HETBA